MGGGIGTVSALPQLYFAVNNPDGDVADEVINLVIDLGAFGN